MSQGSPFSGNGFSPMGTKENSACGSRWRRISQAHAIRSTPIFFQVTHFMFCLRVSTLVFPAQAIQALNGRNPAQPLADIVPKSPADRALIFRALSIDQRKPYPLVH